VDKSVTEPTFLLFAEAINHIAPLNYSKSAPSKPVAVTRSKLTRVLDPEIVDAAPVAVCPEFPVAWADPGAPDERVTGPVCP
jgi:hypothetical protein